MADLTIANLVDIVENISKRVEGINTAATVVKADIAAAFTRYQGFNDDTGVGSLLATACTPQTALVDNIGLQVARIECAFLAGAFQSSDTTPTDSGGDTHPTVDAFYAAEKSGQTNPLLANEFVQLFRSVNGIASLSAVNCAAPNDTLYGSSTVDSGGASTTDVLVAAPVDTELYAGGVLKAVLTSVPTTTTTYTLTGVTLSGSTWTGSVVIADDALINSEHTVVPTIAKTYPVKLTAVGVSGGTEDATVDWKIAKPYTYTQ
jgi:hypothetical protein